MSISRRALLRHGVGTFTLGFAAPAFLSDLASAQGARARNLVVVYLNGGNDSLNTVIPYQDAFYASRRPTIAIAPGTVLQIGTDASGKAIGLHPRLTGLQSLFRDGRLAVIQRTGYANSTRSHFVGQDVYGTADIADPTGSGWLGLYLETVDAFPLVGWSVTSDLPRALLSGRVGVPAIADARTYSFSSPNSGTEAALERATATRLAALSAASRSHLAFVNGYAKSAMDTLDRVAAVGRYGGTVTYPAGGFAQALRTVAGSIAGGVGTRVYWVQTGGYDTHATQGAQGGGAYGTLMATLGDGLLAFTNDLRNQGLFGDTMILVFSEFGRRISENGSGGTDHGAAGVMLAIGGAVRGGIYGTAASLDPNPGNPTLENNGGDVRFETDFRAVYARVLESWLGAPSAAVLGGNFLAGAPAIV